MKNLVEPNNLQVAEFLETTLSKHGVKSEIEQMGEAYALQVEGDDNEKAMKILTNRDTRSHTTRPVSFWAAFSFSLGFILLGLLLLSLLEGAIGYWIIVAIVCFAGALTIINLPIEIRNR